MADAVLELTGYRAYAWFGGYWELRAASGTELFASRTELHIDCCNLESAMVAAATAIWSPSVTPRQ